MKYSRLLVGLLIILLALWILVGEQITGASADAFVNARVVSLRSDVAGDLELDERDLGARISEGEVLGTVSDDLADNVRLNDLLLEVAFAEAEVARLKTALVEERGIRGRLEARSAIYSERRIAELTERLAFARERLEILEAEGAPDDDTQALADAVSETVDRAPAEPLLADLALNHARERVATLEIALEAARDGVFLGDGYNDAPNVEQRRVELESAIAAQEAALAEAEARLAALEERVTRERLHVNSLTGGELRAPVDGLYWQVLQGDGVTVQRGDPILRLVDCDAVFVSLSVTENVYNTLSLGQEATFRIAGDSRAFPAFVSRLAGSGAATVYETLAVAPSERHLQRYDVTLVVPALADAPDLACAIGRTGRVFFDRRPLDALRGLFG